MSRVVLFVARGLFSLFFFVSAVEKLIDWEGAVAALEQSVSQWYIYLEGSAVAGELYPILAQNVAIILAVSIALEIFGALLILIGLHRKLGAFFLFLFMIIEIFSSPPFWLSFEENFRSDQLIFLKNLSIVGALLYFLGAPPPRRAES